MLTRLRQMAEYLNEHGAFEKKHGYDSKFNYLDNKSCVLSIIIHQSFELTDYTLDPSFPLDENPYGFFEFSGYSYGFSFDEYPSSINNLFGDKNIFRFEISDSYRRDDVSVIRFKDYGADKLVARSVILKVKRSDPDKIPQIIDAVHGIIKERQYIDFVESSLNKMMISII